MATWSPPVVWSRRIQRDRYPDASQQGDVRESPASQFVGQVRNATSGGQLLGPPPSRSSPPQLGWGRIQDDCAAEAAAPGIAQDQPVTDVHGQPRLQRHPGHVARAPERADPGRDGGGTDVDHGALHVRTAGGETDVQHCAGMPLAGGHQRAAAPEIVRHVTAKPQRHPGHPDGAVDGTTQRLHAAHPH
jgi:hypothetical protein